MSEENLVELQRFWLLVVMGACLGIIVILAAVMYAACANTTIQPCRLQDWAMLGLIAAKIVAVGAFMMRSKLKVEKFPESLMEAVK